MIPHLLRRARPAALAAAVALSLGACAAPHGGAPVVSGGVAVGGGWHGASAFAPPLAGGGWGRSHRDPFWQPGRGAWGGHWPHRPWHGPPVGWHGGGWRGGGWHGGGWHGGGPRGHAALGWRW